MIERGDADLVRLFVEELTCCRVQAGESVLIFTDPQSPFPEYVGAAFAAARALGAESFILTAPSDSVISADLAIQAWKTANLVVAITTIPWLYTVAHNDALRRGTRTLMIQEPVSNLRRLFPIQPVTDRTYAGAKRIAAAREIRVTDEGGSDFTLRKDGRKGAAQVGFADRPGRFDHWPSGMVATAPLEDSAEGVYVIQPGDAVLPVGPHGRLAAAPIRLTLHEGLITSIDGGYDAMLLHDFLASFKQPDAFRFSHAGWGTEHRALWSELGQDCEGFYGSVMVSIGGNIFDAPDESSGLGGTNTTRAHVDVCCRNKSLFLDGELIVDKGKIVPPELA
jgi:2,5-dihydroxypyridine 5,6-dioxygenase